MAETVKKAKTAAKPRKAATKKASAPASADPVVQSHPSEALERSISHEEVARLAHSYWKQRGHRHGQHEDDWFRAEQELLGKAS